MNDEQRVDDFIGKWGRRDVDTDRPRADLLAMLAEVRAEASAASSTTTSDVLQHIDERARAVLASLAPPGTPVTPAILEQARARIVDMLSDVLVSAGMPETQATVLARLFAPAIKLHAKT